MSFACVCAIMWHWSSMFFSNICSSFLFFFNNPGCPGHTTRFHSFTDGPIPSVYDYKFVGDFFTDVIADGLRPSAFPSSVIPHSVGISVGKTKKPFPDGFTDGICAQKKKDSRLKYTDGFLFRWWYCNYRRKISVGNNVGECMKYRSNLSVCKFVGIGGSYC